MVSRHLSGMHVPLFSLQLSQRMLSRLGLTQDEWAEFVRETIGVDPREEATQETLIAFSSFVEVLGKGTRLIGAGRLLRWYVEDARLMQLGPVGVAALTAPTLGDSLDVWLRYAHSLAPVMGGVRRDTRQDIILTWQLTAPLPGLEDFYTELVLLNLKHQLEYVARAPGAVTLRFAHAPVARESFYRERFGSSVTFGSTGTGQPENTLVIPRDLLATTNDAHVPMVWKQALVASQALAARVRGASCMAPRVRELLAEGAARGHALSLDQVASRLGVSTRTLARRLGEEGACFRDIVGQSRIEHAMRQLRQTNLPIKAIGANAGFSNFSAFSRAFRKMTELSPSEYRGAM